MNNWSVASVAQARAEQIISRWRGDPNIIVQAESAAVLPFLVTFQDPSTLEAPSRVPRYAERNAAVVRRPGLAHPAQLWVRASEGFSGYRNAFFRFLKDEYAIDDAKAQAGGFDVDHLLNRARAPTGTTLVRVELVRSEVNQAWGRTFEKASSDPRFYANRHRERRTMSWMICAKVGGQMPPGNADDQAGIDRLVGWFNARLGLPRDEAEEGLRSMLDFAYRR